MSDNDIIRTTHVVGEILCEMERPDRDDKRLLELRRELSDLARKDEMKPIRLSYSEAFSLLVTFMLMIGLIAYLCSALHTSRENERELSRRIYQSVRQGTP